MRSSLASLWHDAKASLAFVERNFNLVKRYFAWEVVFLFYAIVNTLTIGLIGVRLGPEEVLYLVIGALLWGFLSVLFNEVSQSVSWERWEGTIEYTFMAPVRRISYLLGVSFFAVLYGVIKTSILLLAVAFFFEIDLSGANLWAALVILVISSFPLIGLGLIAAVLPLMSPERGPQATHIIQGFILLISGIYYEVTVLPSWLQVFSAFSPATYTLRAARQAILEGASVWQLIGDIQILIIFGIILIPLGYWIFTQGEKYAMRTGKLKRNG